MQKILGEKMLHSFNYELSVDDKLLHNLDWAHDYDLFHSSYTKSHAADSKLIKQYFSFK